MTNYVIDPKRGLIPQELARFGAGKDAYLRKLTGTCGCCGRKFVLDTSESGHCCQECYDIAGIENEIADGYSTREEMREELEALNAAIVAAGGKSQI